MDPNYHVKKRLKVFGGKVYKPLNVKEYNFIEDLGHFKSPASRRIDSVTSPTSDMPGGGFVSPDFKMFSTDYNGRRVVTSPGLEGNIRY
jgi:hypothetical protein